MKIDIKFFAYNGLRTTYESAHHIEIKVDVDDVWRERAKAFRDDVQAEVERLLVIAQELRAAPAESDEGVG